MYPSSFRSESLSSLSRRLSLVLFVAQRIVRSRRSRRLSAVTLISMVGVAFGVMALTVVLGVTGGFQEAFQQRILGLYPHLVVLKRGRNFQEDDAMLTSLREIPGLAEASPATYDDMMMAAGAQRAGAVIKGVELGTVGAVLDVDQLMVEGALADLEERPEVRLEGSQVQLKGVPAGQWQTVVLGDDDAGIIAHDRTSPDPGRVRVYALNSASSGESVTVTLHDSSAIGDRAPVTLTAAEPLGRSVTAELAAGLWRAEPHGQVLDLRGGTVVALAFQGAAGGLTPLVSEGHRPPSGSRAMVRLLDTRSPEGCADGSCAKRSIAQADPLGESIPVEAGAHTGFFSVPAVLPGVILGRGLAERLEASLGDEVTVVTPLRGVDNKMLGPYGMTPTSSRMRVVGLFESGFHEYDVRLALINIRAAQRMLNRGRNIRWIEIRADDIMAVGEVKRRVAALVDPYDMEMLAAQANGLAVKMERYLGGDVRQAKPNNEASFVGDLRDAVGMVGLLKYQDVDMGYRPNYRLVDWKEMNTNLFSALKLQKVVLAIFFLIIIIVGSFVVVGSQIMVIHEKTPDIAILKAMGATSGMIRGVFTFQGLLVAGVGTVIGMAVGLGVCALVDGIDYRLDASVYLIDQLPIALSTLDLVLVASATALCTLGATQYSAARAAAKTPIDGLRAID